VSQAIVGLITAQQFSWCKGRGHYANMFARKVFAYEQGEGLWDTLWRNAGDGSHSGYPWMDHGEVNPWWLMPLKIRLHWDGVQCTGFYTEVDGIRYDSEINHPLALDLNAQEDNISMDLRIRASLGDRASEQTRVFGIHWNKAKMVGVFHRTLQPLEDIEEIEHIRRHLYLAMRRVMCEAPSSTRPIVWTPREEKVQSYGVVLHEAERMFLDRIIEDHQRNKTRQQHALDVFDLKAQSDNPRTEFFARCHLVSSLS
jgi:hypothetical protein